MDELEKERGNDSVFTAVQTWDNCGNVFTEGNSADYCTISFLIIPEGCSGARQKNKVTASLYVHTVFVCAGDLLKIQQNLSRLSATLF